MVAVLFVCLGNICRSPAGEGILKLQAKDNNIHIESCGLGDWHVGQFPDGRMRDAAMERGVVLTSRAQQFKEEFFDRFDYILAVDNEVLHSLYRYAKTPEHRVKIYLITAFSSSYPNQEIPDPFYGGRVDFDRVLDMLEDSCEGILQEIAQKKKNDA